MSAIRRLGIRGNGQYFTVMTSQTFKVTAQIHMVITVCSLMSVLTASLREVTTEIGGLCT